VSPVTRVDTDTGVEPEPVVVDVGVTDPSAVDVPYSKE